MRRTALLDGRLQAQNEMGLRPASNPDRHLSLKASTFPQHYQENLVITLKNRYSRKDLFLSPYVTQ